jgi:5-methylcytosine-specific restriction endonuclease McrA
MAKRQKQWAINARFTLTFVLGGQCACGETKELDFDCIEPQGDRHHKMDTSARMSFYRKQHKNKNLQLLCKQCHKKKNKDDELKRLENEPF